ncbi:tRNA (5-methylaminomethyl-2-thiouridine)(34)-methyltransferase MnmD [Deinococcus radiomollis]|uniref:tRNA (5-methylaminomethyl-2-thiouridine)(34)-methyltransferase MnmD n=1 Tax=Deinococcus radiomollis TaxID=468916 RepID=UPI003891E8E1
MPDPPKTDSELQPTADGSLTAHSARFGQSYGSRFGAATQARQVFVEGSGTHLHPAPKVLEVGFGLGQNFRATLAATAGRPLHYLAYEFDPVGAETLRQVAFSDPVAAHPGWQALMEGWPSSVAVPDLKFDLRLEDVTLAALPQGWASAVYLDGFSPDVNPEVWTAAFLGRLAAALQPGGVLVTYSAAGHVRRGLQAAGLEVERRPGPAGKREVLRAARPAT